MHIGVGILVMQIVDKTLYLRRKVRLEVEDFPTPQLSLIKHVEVEASNNTKVVSPTFERSPQVTVRLGVSVHYLSTGNHKFIVDHVVANEATAVGEIG